MKNLLVALISFFLVINNCSAEWTAVAEGEDDNITYIDIATIRNGSVWILTDFKTPRAISGKEQVYSFKYKVQFNCAQDTRKTLSTVSYSAPMGKGKVIDHFDYNDNNWSHVIPGSVMSLVLTTVCRR